MSFIFHVHSPTSWEINQRDGKWFCDLVSNERMRVCADGSLLIGNKTPIKSYPFLTREWAMLCLRRMQEMDRAFDQSYSPLTNAGMTLGVGASFANQFVFSNMGSEVVRIGHGGNIEKFDLPFFVWAWFRNTPIWRGLVRLWRGERGEA